MTLKSLYLGMLVLVCAIGFLHAESAITETRTTLEKWVETRQLISKTRSDWQSDKELLEQTEALYERELKSVDDEMSKVSTNSTQVTHEMAEAEALKQASNEALDRARQFAAEFEVRLKSQISRFPTPLQDTLKPLLARLPADPASTKMLAAERLQVIVGILNELDKFNNSVNVFSEKRKNDKGEEVSVQTLYVGLGAAYFVNDTADFAGAGTPGSNGWEWSVKPGIAPAVRDAIKMYRNEHTAGFISLPVAIQ